MSTTATRPYLNRIVRYAEVAPETLLANPKNVAIHALAQQVAVNAVLEDVGFVMPISVQDGTDVVLDGHLRVALAIRRGQPTIPVAYADVDDAAADKALVAINATAQMAGTDPALLQELLAEIDTDHDDLRDFLDGLAATHQIPSMMGRQVEPPEAFRTYDEDIDTEHACPSCGYTWSGKAS